MRMRTRLLIALAVLALAAAAWGDDPAMTRQASKGTLIVVSNLERASFEQAIADLRPQYVLWVSPESDRQAIEMPETGLAMILFLLTTADGLPQLHPSWTAELPVPLTGFANPSVVTAARVVEPASKPTPRLYTPVLVMAPTAHLVDGALCDAMQQSTLPLKGPVVRDVADLRHVRAMACLSVIGKGYDAGISTAAESALYRGLLWLDAFRVVGRENAEVALAPSAITARRAAELGNRLRVQALAYVDITEAQTRCEEQTRYRKTNKTSVSPDRQREFDQQKAKAQAEGRKFEAETATPDLVWAAPYKYRECTTSVRGSVKIIDAPSGVAILTYEIGGAETEEEVDEPRTVDYGWYRRKDVDKTYTTTHTFLRPVSVSLASEMVRRQVAECIGYLQTRALLPTPESKFAHLDEPADEGPRARVLSVDGDDVFIDFGQDRSVRQGDSFSMWAEKTLKDPQTGATIEVITIRQSTLVVVEVYERTSRCRVVKRSEERPLTVGDELTPD